LADLRKLSIHELLVILTFTSFSEQHNKLRSKTPTFVDYLVIFNLFDFDNNHGLEQDEFSLALIIFLEAIGRLTKTTLPDRTDLEDVARAIFSVRDGRITISELAAWIDLNKPLTDLFKVVEPPTASEIREKTSTFLPISKPKEAFTEYMNSNKLSLKWYRIFET